MRELLLFPPRSTLFFPSRHPPKRKKNQQHKTDRVPPPFHSFWNKTEKRWTARPTSPAVHRVKNCLLSIFTSLQWQDEKKERPSSSSLHLVEQFIPTVPQCNDAIVRNNNPFFFTPVEWRSIPSVARYNSSRTISTLFNLYRYPWYCRRMKQFVAVGGGI